MTLFTEQLLLGAHTAYYLAKKVYQCKTAHKNISYSQSVCIYISKNDIQALQILQGFWGFGVLGFWGFER